MNVTYKYTNKNMTGWEFLTVQDNGTDGYFYTGNTASTTKNISRSDIQIVVKTKQQLKDIADRLNWLGKFSSLGVQ